MSQALKSKRPRWCPTELLAQPLRVSVTPTGQGLPRKVVKVSELTRGNSGLALPTIGRVIIPVVSLGRLEPGRHSSA